MRRHPPLLVAVMGCLVASMSTGARPAGAAPSPVAGFVDEVVITGLSQPTDLEFAADGTVFVAEQAGLVRRFASIGAAATTYADLRDEVLFHGSRGLNGIAVSPAYPSTPNVWALYSLDQALAGGAIPAFGDTCTGPCPSRARVTRLTGTTTATTRTAVLDGWCELADKHSVADVELGSDGMLYVSSGDSATATYADVGQTDDPCGDPVGEGGSLRAQDLRTSGDPVGYEAKVLRVDPTTGAAAAGNPSSSSDPSTRRIIADGLRNPWRLTLRPGTSELYIADNGANATDELNVVDPTTGAVPNFGWPCFEGAAVNTPFASTGICGALARSAVTDPTFAYGHDVPQFAGSACAAGTNGTSITGLTFIGTNSYPSRLHGALFVGDYARKCISAARVGPDGRPNFGAMEDIVLAADGPMDLETGPSGDVFYLDYVGGTVHRIRWTGPANPAPTPAFTSVTPARVLDTRSGTKPTAGSTRTIPIAGRGGVPTTGAAAVAITLTGTQPDDLAYLTTWPTGPRPNASTLNLTPGQTTANTAIVPLAPDGTIQLYTSGRTHLLVDITAWIPTTTALTSVTPTRVLDTRSGTKPTAGSTRTIPIAGRGGVPTTGAAAVAITLTGTQPDDLAYLTTWPTGPRPNASTLNLTPGQTTANTAIVPLAPDGTIQLYTSGRTHLLVDITAWIPTTTALTSVTPTRVLDTRSGTKPTAGSTRTIPIAGRGGVPTTGAAAVAITLTGTQPDDLAYLTTWPTGPRPNASTLNLTPGQTTANTAIVPLAPDGTIQLYTSGRTHLLVDITAWIPTAA